MIIIIIIKGSVEQLILDYRDTIAHRLRFDQLSFRAGKKWHTGVILTSFRSFNPFAPRDFAEKRVLKLVEWFSGQCCAIKS